MCDNVTAEEEETPCLVKTRWRQVVEVGDATINVERWAADKEQEAPAPMLFYVHGVCESAETVTVRRVAERCLKCEWQLAVPELEGHGLSSGDRAVCGDFGRLVDQTAAVIEALLPSDGSWALCGSSLGGAVAAYVAERLSHLPGFVGLVLFAPAVGVDARVVPSDVTVMGLRLLAALMPAATLGLTPLEDPAPYNWPADSQRNFSGHWPLATSRMLLDITNGAVTRDQENGTLNLFNVPLLLVVGSKDHVVPHKAAKKFFDRLKGTDKQFMQLKNAGHDLTVDERVADGIVAHALNWLQDRREPPQAPSEGSRASNDNNNNNNNIVF